MKALVVTLGTRDLQIYKSIFADENFHSNIESKTIKVNHTEDEVTLTPNSAEEGFYIVKSPRKGGEKILRNYNVFKPHLKYPILKPSIEKILSDPQEKLNVVFIATDQDGPETRFTLSDTIEYAYIIEKLIKEEYPTVKCDNFIVNERVTDMDFQFKKFDNDVKNHLIDDDKKIEKIYLMAQGGIDQINMAITLKMIEHFPDLILLQKNEGEKEANESSFALTYRFSLESRKIREFIKENNYSAARKIILPLTKSNNQLKPIKNCFSFLDNRINFKHQQNISLLNQVTIDLPLQYIDNYKQNFPPQLFLNELDIERANFFYTFEIASICQLYFKKGNFSLGTLTFIRFVEELSKSLISELFDIDLNNYNERIQILASENRQPGIPDYLNYINENCANSTILKIIEAIKPTISIVNGERNKGINLLRNHVWLIHENNTIDKSILNGHCQNFITSNGDGVFDQIMKALNMPEENIYDSMNNELLLKLDEF